MLPSYISFTPSSVPVCTSVAKIFVEDIPAITEMYDLINKKLYHVSDTTRVCRPSIF